MGPSSGMLSYLYSLQHHKSKSNWEEVQGVQESFLESDFQKKRSLLPDSIPQPPDLKTGFLKPWSPTCGTPYARWVTGQLSAWCLFGNGARANVDMESLKNSETHCIDIKHGWASTAYKGGRNKLSGRKKGNVPWNTFFLCICPKSRHKPVSEKFAWSFDKSGNPTMEPDFCTECPLNSLELKRIRAGDRPFRLFSKWTKTPQTWASNHGDPAALAVEWLGVQGVTSERPFNRNSGRKSLAAWLRETTMELCLLRTRTFLKNKPES